QSPVVNHPEKGGGVVHGITAQGLPTIFKAIAPYVKIYVTTGAKMNGIINTGFITIGTTNITGSLILNMLGQIVIFLKLLYISVLEKSKRIAKVKNIQKPTNDVQLSDTRCVIK